MQGAEPKEFLEALTKPEKLYCYDSNSFFKLDLFLNRHSDLKFGPISCILLFRKNRCTHLLPDWLCFSTRNNHSKL